jgi:hypothetical protein
MFFMVMGLLNPAGLSGRLAKMIRAMKGFRL